MPNAADFSILVETASLPDLMTDDAILQNLLSNAEPPGIAWEAFLRRFSNLILKVVWQFEKDYDEAMEKYLFVCRKLAENDFARLRRFQRTGEKSAQFTTWLAAVANNLCIDSHRSRHGRQQLPRPILELPEFDREVFRLYYWKGYSHEEIEGRLVTKSSGDSTLVTESLSRIQSTYAGMYRSPSSDPVTIGIDESDPRLTSEQPSAELGEMLTWLKRWLTVLTDQEQLIIRLRFWEDLTGPEIAKAMRISPEEKVYPLLQKALARLRAQAEETYESQKSVNASVSHIVKGQHRNAS